MPHDAPAGEVGSIVLYVCDAQHNAAQAICEAGDPHPAMVAEVLNRDADGSPRFVLLAVITPGLPTLQWIRAMRASRQPGAGATVIRLKRGAPPDETCRNAHLQRTGGIQYTLDYPLAAWHPLGE